MDVRNTNLCFVNTRCAYARYAHGRYDYARCTDSYFTNTRYADSGIADARYELMHVTSGGSPLSVHWPVILN